MHELSVTESILEICKTHAALQDAVLVTDVYLVIGQLSSIVDDSVQFYWEFVTEDTICQNSKLHFKRIPASFECLDCHTIFSLTERLEPCPKCGSLMTRIEKGEEFYVESILIEKEKVKK